MTILESNAQSKIIVYMESLGFFVTKIIQSTTNGIPDLLCIRHNGHAVWIEAKRPGRKNLEEPLQIYRHTQLRKVGCTVIIATSVEEVKEKLKL